MRFRLRTLLILMAVLPPLLAVGWWSFGSGRLFYLDAVVASPEQNRDGQLKQLLTVEYPDQAANLKSVAFGDGMPASAKWVREGILAKYKQPAEQR